LEHSNLLKVTGENKQLPTNSPQAQFEKRKTTTEVAFASIQIERNPTTDALTAAILIYAIGAGITAAAGTRLALQ
jgi:hypothetical protein